MFFLLAVFLSLFLSLSLTPSTNLYLSRVLAFICLYFVCSPNRPTKPSPHDGIGSSEGYLESEGEELVVTTSPPLQLGQDNANLFEDEPLVVMMPGEVSSPYEEIVVTPLVGFPATSNLSPTIDYNIINDLDYDSSLDRVTTTDFSDDEDDPYASPGELKEGDVIIGDMKNKSFSKTTPVRLELRSLKIFVFFLLISVDLII